MNISLTPELETFVTRKVRTGMYTSQSEVVREGLRLLRERDLITEARMNDLRDDIAIGLKQAQDRDLVSGQQVFNDLRKKSLERRAGAK